jgi:hypothetical protein
LRAVLTQAGAPHRVDVGVPVARSFADADLLVCDISGMAVDWLAMDRPLVITEPVEEGAWRGTSPLREAVPGLSADAAATFAGTVTHLLDDEPSRRAREALARYYLGDTAPGMATKRFVAACRDVIVRRRGKTRPTDTTTAADPAEQKGE